MGENGKKGGLRSLLFRDDTSSTPQSQPQSNSVIGKKKTTVTPTPTGMFTSPASVPSYNPIITDSNLVETFVEKLQELINQNNQTGFDFLEFTETLFEESENPDSDVFKMVFRIAQKMDKSLTPDKLIQSANYYKSLAQQTADTEISKGQNKKNSLLSEKDTERKSLEKIQRDANTQIEKLNSQISELQTQSNNAGLQLDVIDQKYNEQFVDIDTKVSAINAAKEQVINSIIDVESGITSNLK
jgi:hypothetical protein